MIVSNARYVVENEAGIGRVNLVSFSVRMKEARDEEERNVYEVTSSVLNVLKYLIRMS